MNFNLLVLAIILLVASIRSHWTLRRAVNPMPPITPPDAYPAVTVIRPIRDLDAGAEENIHAALDHGYPGAVETFFVFDDATDPTLPLVRRALASLPDSERATAHILFSGAPPNQQTGKLHAMLAGFARAQYDIIVFADSDIRPARDALTALVATLTAADDVGSAFAPVVVTSALESAGDAGYALMLNGLYSPAAYLAMGRAHGRSPFIMGQFMALRRSAITAIGGLESLEGQFVDDMYLGELITKQGLRNQLSWQSVPFIQGGLDFGGFWRLYRRWIAFSQSGLRDGPGSVKRNSVYRGVLFGASLGLAVAAALLGVWAAAAVGLIAALTIVWSIGALHLRLGGAPMRPIHRAMALAILLLAPLIYLANALDHDVVWRGRAYHLDGRSRLAVPVGLDAEDKLKAAARARIDE